MIDVTPADTARQYSLLPHETHHQKFMNN